MSDEIKTGWSNPQSVIAFDQPLKFVPETGNRAKN